MITLGDRVQDRVNGMQGIATGLCEYMNGCVQVLISPRCKEDGSVINGRWVDVGQVELMESNPLGIAQRSSSVVGGPQSTPTGMPHP